MACINMLNNDQRSLFTTSSTMGPRISFSNDFADTQQQTITKHQTSSNYKEAPVSLDFQFSVADNNMTTADEIFFKGMLLPYKDSCCNNEKSSRKTTTLRDELLADDDDDNEDDAPALRMFKGGSGRWKARLGLKRSHGLSSKRGDKSFGGLERVVEEKSSVLIHEDGHVNKKTQELLNFGGQIYRDLETGI